MSEWLDNQKQSFSSIQNLLQERIEKATPRRDLTVKEAKCLSKLEVIADKLKRGENVQNRQFQTWLSDDQYEQFEYEWQEQLELREELKDKPKECLDCLGYIKPHKLCLSFPKKYKKDENIRYLRLLKKSASQIIFYSQNELQKGLLKKHFGDKIKVKVVGMNINVTKKHQEIIESKNPSYDIVFHGRSLIAKGIIYVIKLAEFLPDITFLIPDSKENVLEVLDQNYNFSENITFKKMDWESGLKEAVISARLVINSSLWSAPIEAALVKSSTYNQNVATVESIYGYEKEIKKIENHIRLSADILIAAKQLKNFFQQ